MDFKLFYYTLSSNTHIAILCIFFFFYFSPVYIFHFRVPSTTTTVSINFVKNQFIKKSRPKRRFPTKSSPILAGLTVPEPFYTCLFAKFGQKTRKNWFWKTYFLYNKTVYFLLKREEHQNYKLSVSSFFFFFCFCCKCVVYSYYTLRVYFVCARWMMMMMMSMDIAYKEVYQVVRTIQYIIKIGYICVYGVWKKKKKNADLI